MSDEAVSQLISMGFDQAQAEQALQVSDGNLEAAINLLLTETQFPEEFPSSSTAQTTNHLAEASGSTTTSRSDSGKILSRAIVAPISQYSVDNGRSACTCIALTAASDFLQHPTKEEVTSPTPEMLRQYITDGVSSYQQIVSSASSSVEHTSCEEILATPKGQEIFGSRLECRLGIRQGVLTTPGMDMGSILEGLHMEVKNGPLAILITKTPETIVVFLPKEHGPYHIFDSHPRPGKEDAYWETHTSWIELIQALNQIFPATSLGPDIPDMMAMMYNSFDMYPLTSKNK